MLPVLVSGSVVPLSVLVLVPVPVLVVFVSVSVSVTVTAPELVEVSTVPVLVPSVVVVPPLVVGVPVVGVPVVGVPVVGVPVVSMSAVVPCVVPLLPPVTVMATSSAHPPSTSAALKDSKENEKGRRTIMAQPMAVCDRRSIAYADPTLLAASAPWSRRPATSGAVNAGQNPQKFADEALT